ncbi:MAG: HAD-IB family hydrolase [Planctomycetota bacterium]|nr:HAD-IB family hydrolase [Planctomycetota bacterium]
MPEPASSPPRAAYFDVDGTLARSDIVGPLILIRKRLQNPLAHALWLAALPPRGLYWYLLDKRDRAASNRAIYACYGGLDAARVKALAGAVYEAYWTPRLFPLARARLDALKAGGARPVFVTGGLDFLVEPLARDCGAEVIAPALEERGGRFTGRLAGEPLAGEAKAEALRAHAQARGIDLAASHAFGDAFGDIPMLETVGHPVAVNPGRRLRKHARERGWPVEWWGV